MIKQLHKYDVQTTPFIASKDWNFLNTQHEDLILLEQYSDTYIALEFIQYNATNPYGILNTNCNIALEQQLSDPVIYEEGISGSGLFYPNASKNLTGTYKRLVYQQILKAFYNDYHNPLQIFGMETMDFQTSGIQRYLSTYFKVFTIPQKKFGDKIQEGSVYFVDNSYDDNYQVVDDYQGNLIASPNLFSKTQEARSIENNIQDGYFFQNCPPPNVPPLYYSPITSIVTWIDGNGTHSGDLEYFNTNADIVSVTTISGSNQSLTEFLVRPSLTALETIYCQQNPITFLNFTDMPLLNNVFCNNNQLTSLNIINALNLQSLNCQYNQLSSLDLTGAPILNGLICGFNQLTTLNISNNSELIYLNCNTNKLTPIEINNILITLDNFGQTGGLVALDGTGNAAPSGNGITAKTNLQGKGWTVTTN